MAYTKGAERELYLAALAGYQHQHEVLGERIAELRRQISGHRGERAVEKKKVFSAVTRRRMAEAQRRRWEGKKKTGDPTGKKRNVSPEGRERIAEATRKRWEAYRANKAAGGK